MSFDKGRVEEYVRESNKIEDVESEEAFSETMKAWYWIIDNDIKFDSINKLEQLHRTMFEDIEGIHTDNHSTRAKTGKEVRVGMDRKLESHKVDEYLVKWLQIEVESVLDIIEKHVLFEMIHPFEDGNGRIGRLIMLYDFYRINEGPIMWRAKDRQGYYSLFSIEDLKDRL